MGLFWRSFRMRGTFTLRTCCSRCFCKLWHQSHSRGHALILCKQLPSLINCKKQPPHVWNLGLRFYQKHLIWLKRCFAEASASVRFSSNFNLIDCFALANYVSVWYPFPIACWYLTSTFDLTNLPRIQNFRKEIESKGCSWAIIIVRGSGVAYRMADVFALWMRVSGSILCWRRDSVVSDECLLCTSCAKQ